MRGGGGKEGRRTGVRTRSAMVAHHQKLRKIVSSFVRLSCDIGMTPPPPPLPPPPCPSIGLRLPPVKSPSAVARPAPTHSKHTIMFGIALLSMCRFFSGLKYSTYRWRERERGSNTRTSRREGEEEDGGGGSNTRTSRREECQMERGSVCVRLCGWRRVRTG
jgi:hypothetical protein